MAEIALAVIEPNGRRWAQLLDDERPAGEVLRAVLANLRLPRDFRYELVPAKTRRPLHEGETLRQAGVRAGDELLLQPERDALLAEFLDALYEEATGYVAERLWEQAGDRLDTLFRLDPYYPDRAQLRRAVETRTPGGLGNTVGATPPPTPRATPPLASSPPPLPPAAATPPAAQPAAPQAATKGGSGGCLVSVLGVVVIICVVAVLAAGNSLRAVSDVVSGLLTGRDVSSILPFGRGAEPTLGTGDVQITLRWNTAADLDLHVIDPFGQEIWFDDATSDSGGQLDVDANAACMERASAPVENVFWPTDGAPSGQYEVVVVYFLNCLDAGATDYEITIKLDGQVTDTIQGTIGAEGDRQPARTFRYPAN